MSSLDPNPVASADPVLVFGQASRSSLSSGLRELHEKQLGSRPDRLMFF
jgi:hypothetical protein